MPSSCLKICLLIQILHVDGHTNYEDESNEDSTFEQATKSRYFVDKTMLLRDIIQQEGLLITCPKSFGKTTNLDMAMRFFQKSAIDKKATTYDKLFTNKSLNLEITKNDTFMEEHFGKYYTIHMNFADINGETTQQVIDAMREVIVKAVTPYRDKYNQILLEQYVGNSYYAQLLQEDEKIGDNVFDNLARDPKKFIDDFSLVIGTIQRHSEFRFIALIDNYDATVMKALSNGMDSNAITEFIISLTKTIVNEKSVIVVAGISSFLRVDQVLYHTLKKYNYFLKNNNDIGQYFGFTENDVDRLLAKNEVRNDERQKLKKYYNGYNFKIDHNNAENRTKSSLYNPKAVSRYLGTNNFDDHDSLSDPFTPKLLKCLRHRTFFTNVTRLLSKQGIPEYPNYNISKEDLDNLGQMIQNNCTELPRYFAYSMTHFTDYGYATWVAKDHTNLIQIPNLMMEKKLKQEFARFYLDTYGIIITNSHLATNIRSILDSNTTTDEMLTKLSQSLQEILEPKLTNGFLNRFQLESIIVGALYCNLDSYDGHIKIKKAYQKIEARPNDIALLTIPNRASKIFLIIKINFNATLNDAILDAREYVPLRSRNKTGIDLVKYLGINVNKDNVVEVGKGENRNIQT